MRCKKIATIVDLFTHYCFSPSLQVHQLRVDNFVEVLNEFSPDLVFVESAWFGIDSMWRGLISNPSNQIKRMLLEANNLGIPTVFWCKEDPIHFDRFLLTASLFDYVFTTDIDSIPKYKQALGHSHVYLLPFSCQPKIHNPLETFPRKRAISYAGSYYCRFPVRVIDTYNILEASSSILPLEIYDRYLNSIDTNYQFPDKFQNNILGSLQIDNIDIAYKGYEYSINLNTVKDSESMFARRTTELLASGTVIVSNNSKAFSFLFGELIIASDDPLVIRSRLSQIVNNNLLRAKLALVGVRKAMLEHTFDLRLARIMEKVFGLSEDPIFPTVLVILFAKNITETLRIFNLLLFQNFTNWKCLCLIESQSLLMELNSHNLDDRIHLLHYSKFEKHDYIQSFEYASWVSIFHPSDYYGPNYLLDLVLATLYSNASAFGKSQYFEIIDQNPCLQGSNGIYKKMNNFELRSSLVSIDIFCNLPLSNLLKDPISSIEVANGMALDYLSYCRDAFGEYSISIDDISAIVDDQEINRGFSIQVLYSKADSLKMIKPFWIGKSGWKPEKLAHVFGDRFTRDITASIDRFGWHIISELHDGDTCDLLSEFVVPIEELGGKSGTAFYLEAGIGLQIQFLVRFEDVSGFFIEESFFEMNTQNQLIPPASASQIRFGFRITSSGSSRITRLVLA